MLSITVRKSLNMLSILAVILSILMIIAVIPASGRMPGENRPLVFLFLLSLAPLIRLADALVTLARKDAKEFVKSRAERQSSEYASRYEMRLIQGDEARLIGLQRLIWASIPLLLSALAACKTLR